LHTKLKYIADLLKLVTTDRISELETGLLIKAAQHLAVTRLIQIKQCGKLYIDAMPVSLELAALDCIADLFERDNNARLIKIYDYFTFDRDISNLSEEEIINSFSILVMNKLNDGLFRLYADSDPFLNHIIRNIKWSARTDPSIKQISRFGKISLYTCVENERLDNLPEMPMDEMAQIVAGCYKKRTKALISAVFNELNIQDAYRRIYPVIELAIIIKRFFSLQSISLNELNAPDYITDEQDILSIIGKSLEFNKKILIKKFVENGKIDTQTFTNYYSAIENLIYDTYINTDGKNPGYFDYLKRQIPSIEYEEYRRLHHNQFEYMIRIVKDHTKNKLKEMF
jgi:hypothetical protein